MKIKFLGTGSFFTLNNFHTNIIIEENGKNLLIDAGTDLKWSLKNSSMKVSDIDALYISHLHADHAGGVEYLAFGSYFDPNRKDKIQLFGNSELLRKGWKQSWSGGLESIAGKLMGLDDYFDVNMVKANGKFYWEGIEFSIVQVVHIVHNYAIVPAYGLMVKLKDGKKIFFTCDSQHCPNQLTDFYKEADIIFHDCETLPFKSGVHAHYNDLVTLPKEIKNKMYLIHFQDNISSDNIISEDWIKKANDDQFLGFINTGFIISEHWINTSIHNPLQ